MASRLILDALWFQEGTQIHMPERSQGFTLTKDVDRGFILCCTLSTQWDVCQPYQVESLVTCTVTSQYLAQERTSTSHTQSGKTPVKSI
jgi:hypothetical protein